MKRPGIRSGWVSLAAILSLFAAVPASADTPTTILLLAPSDRAGQDANDLQQLRLAMQAHLSAHVVFVRLHPGRPADAESLCETEDVAAVTWLQDDHLHVLVPRLGPDVTVRHVPPTDEGWPARCELMAAMLLSEVTPVFTTDLPTAPVVAEAPESPPETPPGQAPPAPSRPTVRPVASVGYAPVVLSTDGPYLHGAHLGAGIAIGRHLEITLATSLVESAPLDEAGPEALLRRWPVRLDVCATLPLSILDLGLSAGPVLEVWHIRGLEEPALDERASGTQAAPAFGLAFQLRVRATAWLSPFIDAGIDIHGTHHNFLYRGSPILVRAAVQPHLVVGIRLTPGR